MGGVKSAVRKGDQKKGAMKVRYTSGRAGPAMVLSTFNTWGVGRRKGVRLFILPCQARVCA
jgi:hypothetical protein